jgi:hypothetical protein
MDLIRAAEGLIQQNFDSSPNASGLENLTPIGRAAAEYFARDPRAWGSFVGSYFPDGTFDMGCLNMAERMLCETGPWGTDQCTRMDRGLILDLRARHALCCQCP